MNRIKREEGQGLVEYALLLVLVAIAVIIVLAMVGDQVRSVYARVIAGLNGQTISGVGTEYIIIGFGVTVANPPSCTVTATNVEVMVFEDGLLAGAGVPVNNVSAVAQPSGLPDIADGTTGPNGIASIGNLVSTGATCTGTMVVKAGSNSRSVSYSQ